MCRRWSPNRIRQHRIIPTFINSLPRASKMYKTYLPLMPLALEQLDLRGYDLIISSESGPAKGIIRALRRASRLLLPHADALHLEHVSRLPQQRRPGGAADDAAADPLLADVGRDVGGTGRQLCCELGDCRKAHSPILRRGFDRHSSARRHQRVFDRSAFRAWRLLFDGRRTRILQAAGSRGARLQRNEAEARRDRRRRDARRSSPPCRPHGHGDGFAALRRPEAALRAMPRTDLSRARKTSEWCRSKRWRADVRSLPLAGAARPRPLQGRVRCFLRRTNRRGHLVGGQKSGRRSKSIPKRSPPMPANSAGISSFKRCARISMACWPRNRAAIDRASRLKRSWRCVFRQELAAVSITDRDSPSITRHVSRPVANAPVSILIRFGPHLDLRVGVWP